MTKFIGLFYLITALWLGMGIALAASTSGAVTVVTGSVQVHRGGYRGTSEPVTIGQIINNGDWLHVTGGASVTIQCAGAANANVITSNVFFQCPTDNTVSGGSTVLCAGNVPTPIPGCANCNPGEALFSLRFDPPIADTPIVMDTNAIHIPKRVLSADTDLSTVITRLDLDPNVTYSIQVFDQQNNVQQEFTLSPESNRLLRSNFSGQELLYRIAPDTPNTDIPGVTGAFLLQEPSALTVSQPSDAGNVSDQLAQVSRDAQCAGEYHSAVLLAQASIQATENPAPELYLQLGYDLLLDFQVPEAITAYQQGLDIAVTNNNQDAQYSSNLALIALVPKDQNAPYCKQLRDMAPQYLGENYNINDLIGGVCG